MQNEDLQGAYKGSYRTSHAPGGGGGCGFHARAIQGVYRGSFGGTAGGPLAEEDMGLIGIATRGPYIGPTGTVHSVAQSLSQKTRGSASLAMSSGTVILEV